MSWEETQSLIMKFLASAGVGWFAWELHQMRSSVETLNINMASLLERTMNHARQLERHEDRLEDLEKYRS